MYLWTRDAVLACCAVTQERVPQRPASVIPTHPMNTTKAQRERERIADIIQLRAKQKGLSEHAIGRLMDPPQNGTIVVRNVMVPRRHSSIPALIGTAQALDMGILCYPTDQVLDAINALIGQLIDQEKLDAATKVAEQREQSEGALTDLKDIVSGMHSAAKYLASDIERLRSTMQTLTDKGE